MKKVLKLIADADDISFIGKGNQRVDRKMHVEYGIGMALVFERSVFAGHLDCYWCSSGDCML